MQLKELQQLIVGKFINHLLYFTGDEVGIMDIYLNKIVGVTNTVKVRVDTVQEAFKRMQQKRISGSSRCFIVRDDKDYLKQEKIWKVVDSGAGSSQDWLIIIYTSLDKRSKFYKEYKDFFTEFSRLGASMLKTYIKKEIDITPTLSAELAEICECDYSRILLECDKVRHYSLAIDNGSNGIKEPGISHDKALQILIRQGVIYKPIGDITFKFTDAILTRNLADAAEYLLQAKAKGEPEIMVLSVLYNSFKQILMVQGLGNDQSEPTKRTGLTPWQVKMAKDKQGHYTIEELIRALHIVRSAEKGIKTGQLDADIAMEYVIVKIM